MKGTIGKVRSAPDPDLTFPTSFRGSYAVSMTLANSSSVQSGARIECNGIGTQEASLSKKAVVLHGRYSV